MKCKGTPAPNSTSPLVACTQTSLLAHKPLSWPSVQQTRRQMSFRAMRQRTEQIQGPCTGHLVSNDSQMCLGRRFAGNLCSLSMLAPLLPLLIAAMSTLRSRGVARTPGTWFLAWSQHFSRNSVCPREGAGSWGWPGG